MTAVPPHPNGAAAPAEAPRRSRRRRVLAIVAVVFVTVWAYAIWYSVHRTNPERLGDTDRAAVRRLCERARADLMGLDRPGGGTSPGARLGAENAVFESLVDGLDALDPQGEDPATALEAWTDDWRALLAAREAAADELARAGEATLAIPRASSRGVRPVTDRMDEYARQQGLDECRPDALEAETIDGRGDYAIPEA